MKRAIVVLSTLVLLGALIGCGSNSTDQDQNTTGNVDIPNSGGGDSTYEEEFLTKAEKRYLRSIADDAEELAKATNTIAKLSPDWPFWSDEDTIRIGGALATFRVAYKSWKGRSAPSPRFHKLRRLWVRSLKDLNEFSLLYARGVDSMSVSLISKANRLMVRGGRLAARANEEADTLRVLYEEY